MRIAMLHPSLTWRGGAERQMLNLAIELQRAGHTVEIFTCALNNQCYPAFIKQLTVHIIKAPGFQKNQSSPQKRTIATRLAGRFRAYTDDLPAMLALGKSIPKGFDVINNHNFPTEWAAFYAKKRLDAPIVWMCNEPPFWFSDSSKQRGLGKINLPLFEGLDKISVDYIDHIIALSTIAAQRIQNAYGRTSQVIHSGVDIERFHQASGKEIRRKYGLENDFVLLQVGNIARDKRQKDAVTALHYLSKSHQNIKLVFDGQGQKDELIALSKQLGIEDKILYLHSCSDSELAQVYAACDVFVFPAQITWGLAVIEAMATSKPVIVSEKSGAAEVIEHSKNGLILKEPNAQNMAAQIESLIADDTLRQKIGVAGYEYTKQNLSWEIYAKNMADAFQRTIDNYRKHA
jgi:glycosyltransferase involved in cell wall biosynthesis